MQVHYKIPGWEPIREIPAGGAVAPASPFPIRPSGPSGVVVPWRSLLRLDAPRAGAVTLEPPPRPEGLLESSAESETRAMRGLLARHGHEADASAPAGSRAGTPEGAAIREMVLLLLDMQARQDEFAARRLEQEAM